MASRSATVTFDNQTDHAMTRTTIKLSGGTWTQDHYPPETIPANGSGTWQSESDGMMTGTEGYAQYHLEGAGTVEVSWDVPFAGSNSYSDSAPPGYTITKSGGDGNDARVQFILTPSA